MTIQTPIDDIDFDKISLYNNQITCYYLEAWQKSNMLIFMKFNGQLLSISLRYGMFPN